MLTRREQSPTALQYHDNPRSGMWRHSVTGGGECPTPAIPNISPDPYYTTHGMMLAVPASPPHKKLRTSSLCAISAHHTDLDDSNILILHSAASTHCPRIKIHPSPWLWNQRPARASELPRARLRQPVQMWSNLFLMSLSCFLHQSSLRIHRQWSPL